MLDHFLSGNDSTKDQKEVSRRDILKTAAALGGFSLCSMGWARPALAIPGNGSHSISFRNTHTGESFSGVYRVGDKYLPEAFERINYVLRDFRTGEVFPIDPRILDSMYVIKEMSGKRGAYEVLSGYRSPKTNNMLRRASTGVAKKSLHMSGQAIDIRMPGLSTRQLRKHAVKLRAGGVGYYPKSNFVHIDTGKFRTW